MGVPASPRLVPTPPQVSETSRLGTIPNSRLVSVPFAHLPYALSSPLSSPPHCSPARPTTAPMAQNTPSPLGYREIKSTLTQPSIALAAISCGRIIRPMATDLALVPCSWITRYLEPSRLSVSIPLALRIRKNLKFPCSRAVAPFSFGKAAL